VDNSKLCTFYATKKQGKWIEEYVDRETQWEESKLKMQTTIIKKQAERRNP